MILWYNCLSDLDDRGGTLRAALAISAEVVHIAIAECGGCAFTSGWRYFQRTHNDIIITTDKYVVLVWFFDDLHDRGGETESSSGNKRRSLPYCHSRSGCAGMCMGVKLAIFFKYEEQTTQPFTIPFFHMTPRQWNRLPISLSAISCPEAFMAGLGASTSASKLFLHETSMYIIYIW